MFRQRFHSRLIHVVIVDHILKTNTCDQ